MPENNRDAEVSNVENPLFELSERILTSLNTPNTEEWRIFGLETGRCTISAMIFLQTGSFSRFQWRNLPESFETFSADFYRVSIPGDGGRWQGMPAGIAELTAKWLSDPARSGEDSRRWVISGLPRHAGNRTLRFS